MKLFIALTLTLTAWGAQSWGEQPAAKPQDPAVQAAKPPQGTPRRGNAPAGTPTSKKQPTEKPDAKQGAGQPPKPDAKQGAGQPPKPNQPAAQPPKPDAKQGAGQPPKPDAKQGAGQPAKPNQPTAQPPKPDTKQGAGQPPKPDAKQGAGGKPPKPGAKQNAGQPPKPNGAATGPARTQVATGQSAHPFVQHHAEIFRTQYTAPLRAPVLRYQAPTFIPHLRTVYRPYARYGFVPYSYAFHPMPLFYQHFDNPVVLWFYAPYDDSFYRPLYASYVVRYPELTHPFARLRIYYPTEEFINLNISVSAYPIEFQINYRRSMIYLSELLYSRTRDLPQFGVVINHVQLLPGNRGMVVEGFADNGRIQTMFKALVDLRDAEGSLLVTLSAVNGNPEPTYEQIEELQDLNDQIVEFGGVVETENI